MFTSNIEVTSSPSNFIVDGFDYGVIDQFEIKMSRYKLSIDHAIKLSVVGYLQ